MNNNRNYTSNIPKLIEIIMIRWKLYYALKSVKQKKKEDYNSKGKLILYLLGTYYNTCYRFFSNNLNINI